MSNVIKLKRGTSTPSTSDIASDEVAVDTSAKKLYINDAGTIKEIGGGGVGTGQQFVNLETSGSPSNSGNNTFAGYLAGNSLNSADHTTLFGFQAGKAALNAGNNCFFGSNSGLLATGGDNSGFGQGTLETIVTATSNVAVGRRALNTTTSSQNVAVGADCLRYQSSGSNNTAVGRGAAEYLTTTSDNVAIGFEALRGTSSNAVTGASNIAIGSSAGDALRGGSQNTLIGQNAGGAMTGGHWNVIIGKDSLASGDCNGCIILGVDAGTGASGDNNVVIGRGAADISGGWSGDNCVVIGKDADPSSTSVDNEITLGDTNITKFRVPGLNFSIKDSTATDNYVLTCDANGDAGWEAASGTTINNNADNRIITGSGTANTLEAESSLTWNGSSLTSSSSLNLASGAGVNIATTNAYLVLDSAQMIKLNSEQATEIQAPTVEIKNQADNETMAKFTQNGSCFLYNDNSLKLQTTTSGITVTGTCTATTFSGSGASLTNLPADSTKLSLSGGTMTGQVIYNDSVKVFLGSDSDYGFWHDGTNAWHKCEIGNLEFKTYGSNAGNLNFESAGSSTFKVNENTTALTLASNGNATFGGTVTGTFSGNITGNVTGNTSGSAGSCTGTAALATSVTVTANNSTDENVYLAFVDSAAGGTQGIETDSGLYYNPSENSLATTEFVGGLTGNVTGNASGSSGSCTGNAATATTLATARTIAGVSFDGSANISLNNNAITNGAGYITSGGKVGQVVSTTKSNTFSVGTTMNGSAGFTDVTGMSVTITPTSSSSKIMVWAISRVGAPNHANVRLVRGSTAIAVGDTDGIRTRTSTGECYNLGNSYRSMDSSIMYLDSPSTTSATTYKLQIATASPSYFNRTVYDDNHLVGVRPASTITVMEILT